MSNVFVFRQPPHGVITEYFGGGKGGSTTTTNNVTQIPPEVLARYNAVNARAESVASQPYQAYSQDPNAFVAPLTQTQQAGIQNTNAMAGAAQPYYGAATGLAAQSTGSVNPSALNVGQYMNPYTQSVVNATQAALNQQQGQQLSQQQADAIRGGAFGGDRANLQRAQLMGQQSLAQAQAIAPLYQQNYNQALAAAQQQQGVGLGAEQANRQNLQNAATLFGSIGTNAQQAGLAGAQAQLAAGQVQQQTQQAGLQALYNQFQQQQGFPYQQAQFLANIAEGTGALSGNATSGTSTTTGGGGFFSDERLKENIQRVGETDDGQPIYRYNYKGDKNTQIGLLAQDVEKHHPEAVGLAGGYKTVNYKKATEDAVHKADGGEVSDAYRIDAPSAMLRENSGKGLGAAPSLPQAFQGGRNIPIETGARNPLEAGLRSPQVTGVNPESRIGAQAELDSLRNAPSSTTPGGTVLGSGPGYVSSRINTLQDWLNKNASPGPQYSSAGGLVGPEGGAFAQGGSFSHGGLAGGRHGFYGAGYVNPWFEANKAGAQQDLIKVQPSGQHQILRGDMMQAPPQKQQQDPIAAANQAAGLALTGSKIYDWAKKPSKDTGYDNEWAPGEENDADTLIDLNTPVAARGGLIAGRHHYSRGGINPYGGLGGNDILGPIIEQQDTSLRIPGDKGTPAPSSKPQQPGGGIGSLVQAGLGARSALKGGEWAAGKLGLGEASPTAMSATSTKALPSVAGGVVPEAVAPVVPEAVTAAAPEALAAAAPEALAAAAPVVEASAVDLLPFLFLKNGGVVPRQHHADGERVTAPRSAPFAGDAGGADMTEEDKANALIKQLAGQTIAEKAPLMERRPAPVAAPATAETPTRTPSIRPVTGEIPVSRAPFQHFASKVLPEDMNADTKSALTSENLWVPALAGVGAMLASPNKTLAGAIGSGLVGGTTAYTGLQKQQADVAKTEAETRGVDVTNYQKSIQQTPAGNIAWLADGSIMLLGDYDALSRQGKAPPLLGRIPDNAETRVSQWLAERSKEKAPMPTPAPKAAPPANAAPAPVTAAAPVPVVAPKTTAPAAPAPAPEPKKVQRDYDDKSKALADSERAVALNGGTAAANATDVTKRYVAAVTPSATAARDSQRYMTELASNLADATKGKGLDAPGFGFSGRAQFTNALNTLSRAFGGQEFGQGDTIDQINNKLETLQASISAAGGGQESVSALNLLRKAVAGPSMSPRAYSQLAGDLLTTNQRAIDRDIHMSKYAKDSQGLLQNAGQDFERTHDSAMYKREGDAIAKMILTQPELIKDLRSGKYTSQQIDDAFAKQGLRNMSRYFVGRT